MLLTLLLITAVSAAIVPPPTNVTVSCQNLQTTVSWENSTQEPQTRFRVNIRGSAGEYEAETTDYQYNMSHFIWESENYMGFHYVTVTALLGGNQSEPVTSKTFTFNDLRAADIKCKLDFPPARLTVGDSEATVSFNNPFQHLKQASKEQAPTIKFTVYFNDTEFDRFCKMDQMICKQVVVFPDGVEKCVKLKGVLFDAIEVGQVLFREVDHICSTEELKESDVHVITLVILLACFVLFIAVITLIVCKVKAWTMKTPLIPGFLVTKHQGHSKAQYKTVSERDEMTSNLELIVHESYKKPSASSEEEINPQDDNSAGSGLQTPAGCMYMQGGLSESSSEDLGAAELISEGLRTDEDSADDSGNTECVSLVSKEEIRSPYDCPHTHMDMGDGDIVLGYNK